MALEAATKQKSLRTGSTCSVVNFCGDLSMASEDEKSKSGSLVVDAVLSLGKERFGPLFDLRETGNNYLDASGRSRKAHHLGSDSNHD